MEQLDCVLSWRHKAETLQVHIEDPTDLQAEILGSLGYQIKDCSVLQIQHNFMCNFIGLDIVVASVPESPVELM
jgi:hypothetical protein